MSELSKEMKRLRDSIVDAIRDEETINSETVTNEVVIEDDQDLIVLYGIGGGGDTAEQKLSVN